MAKDFTLADESMLHLFLNMSRTGLPAISDGRRHEGDDEVGSERRDSIADPEQEHFDSERVEIGGLDTRPVQEKVWLLFRATGAQAEGLIEKLLRDAGLRLTTKTDLSARATGFCKSSSKMSWLRSSPRQKSSN
jgi:hypothetical protein